MIRATFHGGPWDGRVMTVDPNAPIVRVAEQPPVSMMVDTGNAPPPSILRERIGTYERHAKMASRYDWRGWDLPTRASAIRSAPLSDFAALAASINDSAPLMAVYAAPEWDCLHEDGQQWVAALIRETLARQAEGKL